MEFQRSRLPGPAILPAAPLNPQEPARLPALGCASLPAVSSLWPEPKCKSREYTNPWPSFESGAEYNLLKSQYNCQETIANRKGVERVCTRRNMLSLVGGSRGCARPTISALRAGATGVCQYRPYGSEHTPDFRNTAEAFKTKTTNEVFRSYLVYKMFTYEGLVARSHKVGFVRRKRFDVGVSNVYFSL